MKIEKINALNLDELVEVVHEVQELVGNPEAGELTVENIEKDSFADTAGATHEWVRVTFDKPGVLSLAGILRSPDLSWESKTQKDRIRDLAMDGKLFFTYSETCESKRTKQPYKRLHFQKKTFKAAPVVGAAKK